MTRASASPLGTAQSLLGPTGPLSSHLPGYEVRPGQVEMTGAVEHALARGEVLLCEAGTGTGKTLAYLLPAVLSGKKVVVSTATRALQEQIIDKDLPLLQRALGLDPRAALMKGLANYVCRRRHAELRNSPTAERHVASLELLDQWLGRTGSGDIAEAADLSEHDSIWSEVASSSDTRVGSACPHYDECFVTRMRRAAEAARLVVVNHHLFFADLALRGPHPGRVLPDYDAVIFDEAHGLEDIATTFFGVQLSQARLDRLVRDTERALAAAAACCSAACDPSASRLVSGVRTTAADFWSKLRAAAGAEDTRASLEPDVWVGPLTPAWHALDAACEALAGLAEAAGVRISASREAAGPGSLAAVRDALDVIARRFGQVRQQLSLIIEGQPGVVAWVERADRRLVIGASPVDLSLLLRERVFETVGAVVLTSATLATVARSHHRGPEAQLESHATPFAYLRSRLGLVEPEAQVDATELIVPSPFEFERAAVLYTPRDLPPPGDPAFLARATDRTVDLVELTGGGAFVLTTSLRSMRGLAAGLRERLPHLTVLLQGEAPKQSLLTKFRESGDAVLVATMSFWEGVDVPGRSLRLVVLEKIPFPVPSEPIVRARSLLLEEAGKNPFMELHVPAAAITLKQGFGRLIRTTTDRGIVALLDSRLHRRNYGPRLLNALPPARRTTDFERVRAFWETSPSAE